MQKDLPKPELSLPKSELEIPAKSTIDIKSTAKSKSSLQFLILVITVFFLLGVIFCVVFFLLKSGSFHF